MSFRHIQKNCSPSEKQLNVYTTEMIMRCSYGFFSVIFYSNINSDVPPKFLKEKNLETNETISDIQEEFIGITFIFIVGQMI